MRILVVLLCIFLCCCAQQKLETEVNIKAQISKLDSLMRLNPVPFKLITTTISDLNSQFVHSTHREVKDQLGEASINFKWNTDSSASLVFSNKTEGIEFKRETILHIKDSTLFIHRFLAGPAQDTTTGISFIESYDYLSPKRTIKTLVRVKNLQSLSDSVEFRKLPFNDFSETVQEHYGFELDYCQNILHRN